MNTMAMFMQADANHLLKLLEIDQKFKGWQKVLEQQSTQNELYDVKNINVPDFGKDIENKDYFVFADFLKPGYHQIIIYDPKLNRAYCKDFMVNLNSREDLYPEYPLQEM